MQAKTQDHAGTLRVFCLTGQNKRQGGALRALLFLHQGTTQKRRLSERGAISQGQKKDNKADHPEGASRSPREKQQETAEKKDQPRPEDQLYSVVGFGPTGKRVKTFSRKK